MSFKIKTELKIKEMSLIKGYVKKLEHKVKYLQKQFTDKIGRFTLLCHIKVCNQWKSPLLIQDF